ncbi:hypothetical protein BMWSH_1030 [Priestia megaterium WSH-002]|uniref:Uncharacterized protein n=1 Tax=Priestia megaterium (strain WSH-002) TaxID=1006007 RepID=A0A8D3WYQ2_PRIMW|nr:hypothetical protein BMWSH_1030 [Priestia megaterium WSH-002]
MNQKAHGQSPCAFFICSQYEKIRSGLRRFVHYFYKSLTNFI